MSAAPQASPEAVAEVVAVAPPSERARRLSEAFNYRDRCQASQGRLWMESYPPSHRLYLNMLQHRNERVCALAGSGRRLLDVGCGLGDMLYLLRDRFETLVGMDPSADMVQQCRRNLEQRGLGERATIVQAPAEGMDVPPRSFDTILMLDTYEHIHLDRRAEALRRVRRALAPGGRFILVTPSWARLHFWALLDNLLTAPRQLRSGGPLRLWGTTPKPYTEIFCSRRTLLRDLRRAGFVAQRFERVSFYPAPERPGFLAPHLHRLSQRPRLHGALERTFLTLQQLRVLNQKMLTLCSV